MTGRATEVRKESAPEGAGGEIAKHAFTVLFGRSVIRIAQFVAFVLLARLLSPADFGWFGIVTTAITLAATIGSLGLRQSVAYEIGQRRITPGEAIGTVFVVMTPLVLASAAAVYALYGRALPGISARQAALIIVVGVAGTMILMLVQGNFLGRGEINSFSMSESAPRVALMLIVVAVAVAGAGSIGLRSALWAHVVSYAVCLPLVVWLAVRGVGRLGVRLDRLPTMLRYGLIFAVNLLFITLCSRLPMFVIEHFGSSAAAGEFFAAIRVNEIFMEVATAFGMVLFANAARQEQGVSVLNRNMRIACWMLWLFAAIAAVVALCAPLVIAVILGSDYAAAGPILQILALGLGPAAACKVIYPTLAGSGRPAFGSPVIIAALLTIAVMSVVLVPGFGTFGGAFALVAGQYVLFIGYVVTCRLRFGISLRDFVIPRREDMALIVGVLRRRLRPRAAAGDVRDEHGR